MIPLSILTLWSANGDPLTHAIQFNDCTHICFRPMANSFFFLPSFCTYTMQFSHVEFVVCSVAVSLCFPLFSLFFLLLSLCSPPLLTLPSPPCTCFPSPSGNLTSGCCQLILSTAGETISKLVHWLQVKSPGSNQVLHYSGWNGTLTYEGHPGDKLICTLETFKLICILQTFQHLYVSYKLSNTYMYLTNFPTLV